MTSAEPAVESGQYRPILTVSAGTLAWLAMGLAFVLLRVGPVWLTAVGGAELDGLSGAWRAHLGADDDRFLGTLSQGLAAWMFQFTDSEVPARALVFVATASIPVAVWLLRSTLGEAGALFTLALLAFDGPAIVLETTANPAAFDFALMAWLLVLVARSDVVKDRTWALAPVAGLVAISGPGPLVVAVAATIVWVARGGRPTWTLAVYAAVGAFVGVALASLQFGFGSDGLLVPPFAVMGASAERTWSTGETWELALVYAVPALVAGGAGIALAAHRMWSGDRSLWTLTTLAAAAVTLLWLLASLGANSAVPLATATFASAFLAGPALGRGFDAMWNADWRTARWLIALSAGFTALSVFRVLDWAGDGRVGSGREKTAVAIFIAGAAVSVAAVLYEKRARPTLLSLAFVAGGVLMIATSLGAALGAVEEPVPSPVTTRQAQDLRNVALETARASGGPIVIHPDLFETLTWAFRNSGDLTLASRPGDAAVFIAPIDAPPPEGMIPLGGAWVVERGIQPPTERFLRYVRWLADRNGLEIESVEVAVYTEAGE